MRVGQLSSILLWLAVTVLWHAGPARAANDKAVKLYEDALARFDKKDFEGSVRQLKNALLIEKGMLPARTLLGKALLKNGDPLGAEVTLSDALAAGASRAEIIVPLAQAYLGVGKQRQIFEQPQFDVAGLPAPVQQQLLLVRAAASADIGELHKALTIIDSARAIDPKLPDLWVAEVPIRIRLRQFKEAAMAVERATALAPNSADSMYQKGAVAHVSGNLPVALDAYSRAIAADADHAAARLARAGLYLDLGRFADAGKDLAALQRLTPSDPRAAYLHALLAEKDKRPEDARKALKTITELIDQFPIDYIRYRPQVLMLNGLAHYGLSEPEKARQYFEIYQKAQADSPTAKPLAQVYLKSASYDLAIDVLQAYLKSQPDDTQAMALLGVALIGKGQFARASALMEKAIRVKDAPEFHAVLGMSLLRSGQTAGAVKALETSLQAGTRQTQAARLLITLYMQQGQPVKANAMAEKLVKQQPNHAEFANLLGLAKVNTGDMAAARAAFEKAAQLDDALVQPRLQLARMDIAARAYDAAKVRLDGILKTEPKNTEAMFAMAVLSSRRGLASETRQWLEKASGLSGPRETRWGLALSDFQLRQGNAGAALEIAKQMSAKAPESLPVVMALARAQLASRDLNATKSTLVTATRLASYNPAMQLQIARLQVAAGDLRGATYSLEKALSTQADLLPAQVLMAEIELGQGSVDAAEKRARAIIAQNPRRGTGYRLLGDIATRQGQTAAAQDAYNKSRQIEPATGSTATADLFDPSVGWADDSPSSLASLSTDGLLSSDLPPMFSFVSSYWLTGAFSASYCTLGCTGLEQGNATNPKFWLFPAQSRTSQ